MSKIIHLGDIMKNNLLCSTALVALLLGSSPAMAESPFDVPTPSGWYVSLFGGVTFADDYEPSANLFGVQYSFETEFDNGYVLGIALGTQILPNLRGEIEYAYSNSNNDRGAIKFNGAPILGGTLLGELEVQTVLVNLWYDIQLNGPITPYIGGGIGYGHAGLDFSSGLSDDDGGFAYQLGVGARYAFNERWNLDVSYRFKDIIGLDINPAFGGIWGDDDLQSHNIQAGITYKLN